MRIYNTAQIWCRYNHHRAGGNGTNVIPMLPPPPPQRYRTHPNELLVHLLMEAGREILEVQRYKYTRHRGEKM
jgi:hypothetical protein